MEKNTDNRNNYEDIIELPHHVSATHPHMELIDRAAQFLPFAALTGHGEAIRETARLTNQRIELDENRKEILDEKLRLVIEKIDEKPVITITYFEPDSRKDGGSYVTVEGIMKKFDEYENRLILTNGSKILIYEIIEIDEITGGDVIHGKPKPE